MFRNNFVNNKKLKQKLNYFISSLKRTNISFSLMEQPLEMF